MLLSNYLLLEANVPDEIKQAAAEDGPSRVSDRLQKKKKKKAAEMSSSSSAFFLSFSNLNWEKFC